MTDGKVSAFALAQGEAWTYNYEVDFQVKLGELGHGRRLAVMEYVTRKGEEPPDHSHATEDEMFYVLQGALAFRCGGDTFELKDGGFIYLPRGIEHGYEITTANEVRLLVITAPAPDDQKAGWGGFVADIESQGEPRQSPPNGR
jgi:quercetin dioxygenase-like cupin family protein